MKLLKMYFTTLAIFCFFAAIYAQSPQSFKYQVVVRDNAGDILVSQAVGIRISIHDQTAGGTLVYQETFSSSTNPFGLVNLEIGTGTPSIGTFAATDWGSGPKYLEVEIDPSGGSTYVSMGTTQLLSVPYALYADRSPLLSNKGTANIFAGEEAGQAITSGYDNSFLGYQSGYSTTSGWLNTFIGFQSGFNNQNGAGNTFIGFSTGLSMIDGQLNTFIGDRSGYYNTSGNHNTFFGYKSGFSNISGSENVFLGYKAGYYETGSNRLYIHNSQTSFPLIYGEFDNGILAVNGNLGIGTTSPSQKLEIYGNNAPSGLRITWGSNWSTLWAEIIQDGSNGLTINSNAGGGGWADINFQTNGSTKMFLESGGNLGIGTTTPQSKLDVKGNVIIRDANNGNIAVELGTGLDYAEGFNVSDKTNIEPGTVLCIDSENQGNLKISSGSYDTKVAGIVAGANNLGTGISLGGDIHDLNVALAGRVYCNVDASLSSIEIGDLLTTSSVSGYAMKVVDREKAQGAILGKAMEPMKKGEKGLILVLVTLQ